MVSAVQRFAREDVGAAIDLIETLPERIQLASYRSVVRSLAFRSPEAAVALMQEIGDESVRDGLVPMVSRMWARRDAESALEWVRDLSPGRTRDQAIAFFCTFAGSRQRIVRSASGSCSLNLPCG